MNVLKNIKYYLRKQRKTQVELCNSLGLPKQSFTDWNGGKSKSYLQYVPEIAKFLGVPVNDLYKEEPENEIILDSAPHVEPDLASEEEILFLYRHATPAAKALAYEVLHNSYRTEARKRRCQIFIATKEIPELHAKTKTRVEAVEIKPGMLAIAKKEGK